MAGAARGTSHGRHVPPELLRGRQARMERAMADVLVGASPWEQEVYEQLVSHAAAEAEVLEGYRQLAAEPDAKDVAYLAHMIIDDEERHHRIFVELANALRAEVELRSAEDAVPEVPATRADRRELLEATGRMLALERQDARSLKRLRRTVRPVADTTLWSLIVETMELDTRKHMAILKHLQKMAGGVLG